MKRLTLNEDQKKVIKSKIEKRVALSRSAKANLLPNWSRNILYYSGSIGLSSLLREVIGGERRSLTREYPPHILIYLGQL